MKLKASKFELQVVQTCSFFLKISHVDKTCFTYLYSPPPLDYQGFRSSNCIEISFIPSLVSRNPAGFYSIQTAPHLNKLLAYQSAIFTPCTTMPRIVWNQILTDSQWIVFILPSGLYIVKIYQVHFKWIQKQAFFLSRPGNLIWIDINCGRKDWKNHISEFSLISFLLYPLILFSNVICKNIQCLFKARKASSVWVGKSHFISFYWWNWTAKQNYAAHVKLKKKRT